MCSIAMLFFFFNDTATTEIYTLSLHDALPICSTSTSRCSAASVSRARWMASASAAENASLSSSDAEAIHLALRSEEHTSELQSPCNLVCRLLLETKKQTQLNHNTTRSRPHDRT